MKLDRPDLTVDQLDDDTWLAVEGVEAPSWAGGQTVAKVPPDDVLALLDPCETCGAHVGWKGSHLCPLCINGRRKFDIVVPCQHFPVMAPKGEQVCIRCLGTGTVSRTYTVADDPALLPLAEWWRLDSSTRAPIVGRIDNATHALHLRAT